MSLTAQQPDNNVVRTAVEALAAVLGGTNSLHTNALDEVLALPTEKAAQIALRTQQVIMDETGVANVADPLGGSWYVEALTDEMERQAEEIFAASRTYPRTGPLPRASFAASRTAGSKGEIADASFRYQTAVEKGEKKSSASIRLPTASRASSRCCGSATRSNASRKRVLGERRAARDESAVQAHESSPIEDCPSASGNTVPPHARCGTSRGDAGRNL